MRKIASSLTNFLTKIGVFYCCYKVCLNYAKVSINTTNMKIFKTYFYRMKANDKISPRLPLHKIAWSGLGSFVAIYLISMLSALNDLALLDNLFLVTSFGASAVLVFGAPQVDFSQPRNLIIGHLLCALIGITLAKFIPFDIATLSSLAVSLSVVLMHLTRTMHPPAGATALIAIVGTNQVQNLGFMFVITPIFIGCLLILLLGLVINNLSANPLRQYPKYWF
jgi:CBS-domain-containing membrane protein